MAEPTRKPRQISPFRLPLRALRRAVRRDETGAVAVEFGLLALPFFAIVGAILETALFFLATQIMDSAVDTSVRLVRTGQAQQASYTAADFRNSICDHMFGLFDCSAVKIDVRTSTTFSSVSFAYPLDPTTYDWTMTEHFSPGEGSQIVAVRVYYKWPTILDILSFNLANAGPSHRLLAAVRVFRNEPF